MACQGRLASIELPESKTPIAFERRPQDKKPILYSIPKACAGTAGPTGLCGACVEREQKTAAAVAKAGGKYVANQQTLLHGRFGEPLPPWSHMYGSRWFCETQAEKSLEIPAAVAVLLSDVPPIPKTGATDPVEMPRPRKKVDAGPEEPSAQTAAPKKRGPKKVENKRGADEPSAQTVAEQPPPLPKKRGPKTVGAAPPSEPHTVESAEQAQAKPKPARKFAPKKTQNVIAATQAIGVLQPQPLGEIEVVKISVRKLTIDDRVVYLSTEKDKVYDLKFKYIGRYNRRDDCIESKYPDSDRD